MEGPSTTGGWRIKLTSIATSYGAPRDEVSRSTLVTTWPRTRRRTPMSSEHPDRRIVRSDLSHTMSNTGTGRERVRGGRRRAGHNGSGGTQAQAGH
jgi:hypothetical protein